MNRILSRFLEKTVISSYQMSYGTLKRRLLTTLSSSMTTVVLVMVASSARAGDILFVSDSTTDSQNIPAVLTAGGHSVTVIVDDYMVTGGSFGLAEGTNTALATMALGNYCSIFWSASGPHEPDGFVVSNATPPRTGGLGADGGLHTDPAVFTNLSNYVVAGGFVFITGHDAAANPDDPLLAEFIGGVDGTLVPPAPAVMGEEIRFPANTSPLGAVSSIPGDVLSVGVSNILGQRPGITKPGGVNPLNLVRDLDSVVFPDPEETSIVVEEPRMPGSGSWTVPTPSGLANQAEFVNVGHIAYVANGIFLYEDLPFRPGTFLLDGEDDSWLAPPDGDPVYNAALLNFAQNSCISLPFDDAETPVADPQSVSTPLDTPIDITLTGSDPNGDSLTFAIDTGPSNGTLIETLPIVTYTPNSGYSGPDSFTFVVSDASRTSDPATVQIEVVPNTAPAVAADNATVIFDEGQTASNSGTFSDANGDAVSVTASIGNVTQVGTSSGTWNWTFLATDGPDDSQTVTITADDGEGGVTTTTFSLVVNNVAPAVAADNDPVTVNEGATATNTGTFSDPGLDIVTVIASVGTITQVPSQSGSWSWSYPTTDELDSQTVTITATDSDSAFSTTTFVLNVINVAPSVGADNPIVTVNEGLPAGNAGTFADAGSDTVVVTASIGVVSQVGTQSGTWSWMYGTSDGPDNSQTVAITATDDQGAFSTTTFELVVLNVAPVANDDADDTNEDVPLVVTVPGVLGNDADVGLDSLTASVSTGPSNGTLMLNGDGSFTYTPDLNWFGTDSFVYTATDDDGASDTATVTVEVLPVNDPPTLSVDVATQAAQYSDGISPVTITAADVDDVLPPASLAATNVPIALTVSAGSCAPDYTVPAGTGSSCTWTLSGNVGVGAGTYTPTFAVNDGEWTPLPSATTDVVVVQEDAAVMLDEDNAVAIIVDGPGTDSSQPFSLTVHIGETVPDLATNGLTAAGDIGNANVSMILTPVGPGGSVGPIGSCSQMLAGTGYTGVLSVTCDFSGVPVNTYSVDVTVSGDYYTGFGEDVLTVYDPSLGFTSGGGWFYWPDTMDKTNYGYTMKYGKNGRNVKGNLLIIRHMADGTIYRFKSNALEGLAVGESDSPSFGWASFSGKGTYREPTWPDPIGNHRFTTYVEDHGEPGAGADRIWIEVRDKGGNVLPGLTIGPDATGDAVFINGGNIFVPHTNSSGKKK